MASLDLLGKRVKPLVRGISAGEASTILYGPDDMHISCGYDYKQTMGMIERAKRKLRKEYRQGKWTIHAIDEDGEFTIKSDTGHQIYGAVRSDFRVMSPLMFFGYELHKDKSRTIIECFIKRDISRTQQEMSEGNYNYVLFTDEARAFKWLAVGWEK